MRRLIVIVALGTVLLPATGRATEGFYKDLFMDSGVWLTHRNTLPAADMMGLTYDALASSVTSYRNSVLVTDLQDNNGALLYPDGSPRYRVIYVNGGSSTKHGATLGSIGRQRIRDFVAAGGSYTGSCAGAFLAMLHYYKTDYYAYGAKTEYLHLWPGVARHTGVSKKTHDIQFFKTNHPLVKKYKSVADGWVASVYHNGGCRFDTVYFPLPKGTELLGKMVNKTLPGLHGYYNIMAYKKSSTSGRVVVTCSHPEGVTSGERRDLTAAIISYALDGVGTPPATKGSLGSGVPVTMNSPSNKVGDKQYHYFTLSLPAGVTSLEVTLKGLSDNANLYLHRGARATRLNASYKAESQTLQPKTIKLNAPAAGLWYVAVYGAHTVLNGGEYTLKATWKTAPPKPDAGPTPDLQVIKDLPTPPDSAPYPDQKVFQDHPLARDKKVARDSPLVPDKKVATDSPLLPDKKVARDRPLVPDKKGVLDAPIGQDGATMADRGPTALPREGCSCRLNGGVSCSSNIFWAILIFILGRRRRGRPRH